VSSCSNKQEIKLNDVENVQVSGIVALQYLNLALTNPNSNLGSLDLGGSGRVKLNLKSVFCEVVCEKWLLGEEGYKYMSPNTSHWC
jgi:hypothetical protein